MPIERTAEQERAAIVAWLLHDDDEQLHDAITDEFLTQYRGRKFSSHPFMKIVGKAIERGDHHRGETNNG